MHRNKWGQMGNRSIYRRWTSRCGVRAWTELGDGQADEGLVGGQVGDGHADMELAGGQVGDGQTDFWFVHKQIEMDRQVWG